MYMLALVIGSLLLNLLANSHMSSAIQEASVLRAEKLQLQRSVDSETAELQRLQESTEALKQDQPTDATMNAGFMQLLITRQH